MEIVCGIAVIGLVLVCVLLTGHSRDVTRCAMQCLARWRDEDDFDDDDYGDDNFGRYTEPPPIPRDPSEALSHISDAGGFKIPPRKEAQLPPNKADLSLHRPNPTPSNN